MVVFAHFDITRWVSTSGMSCNACSKAFHTQRSTCCSRHSPINLIQHSINLFACEHNDYVTPGELS